MPWHPCRMRCIGGATARIGAIAACHHAAGPELSFSALYVLPVFLSAAAGSVGGIVNTLITALTRSAVDLATHAGPYDQPLIPLWSLVIRLLVLVIVAALVASVRRQLERERELSRTDRLTGLANVRSFRIAAETELYRMARSRRPFTLAYLDADGSKAVNDAHGHAAGGEFLVQTAQALLADVRKTDIVARLGGEEFSIPSATSCSARPRSTGRTSSSSRAGPGDRWRTLPRPRRGVRLGARFPNRAAARLPRRA